MKDAISGTYEAAHRREQEYSQVEHGPRPALVGKESTIEGLAAPTGALAAGITTLYDWQIHRLRL
jgi:hypothetical protein